jgi:hypothetical protein
MSISAATLTSSTTVPDGLAIVGGQAWVSASGSDECGLALLRGFLSQFQDGLDLALNFGSDGAGVDGKFYGATASNYALWDASANSFLLVGTAALFQQGTFAASAAGSGVALDATNSAAMKVYTDDGGAAIGSGTMARAAEFRNMQTYTSGNREQEGVGVIGKLVSVSGTNRHNMCGVMGSYEMKGTSITVDGQDPDTDPWVQAGVIGRVGMSSGTVTLNQYGVLAGVAAVSNINTATTATYTGRYTGFYVGHWASADPFEYGLYAEHVAHGAYYDIDHGTISGEEHGIDVVHTGTLSSGDGMVGLNVVTTTAGTAGAWASGGYIKVLQGSTKNVNGYLSALELELTNSAANVSDEFVLVLNMSNSGANRGQHESYIALRDYGSTDANSFLWVSSDHTIGTKSDTSLMTTFADGAHITHAIRILGPDATPYWMLCSSTAPSGT